MANVSGGVSLVLCWDFTFLLTIFLGKSCQNTENDALDPCRSRIWAFISRQGWVQHPQGLSRPLPGFRFEHANFVLMKSPTIQYNTARTQATHDSVYGLNTQFTSFMIF